MTNQGTVAPAVVEAFDALAERLARPESWIKGKFAKTSRRGRDVGPEDDKASCWCLAGAIWALPPDTRTPVLMAVIRLLPTTERNTVTIWNDARRRTHQQILELIAQAKAAYIAEGAS